MLHHKSSAAASHHFVSDECIEHTRIIHFIERKCAEGFLTSAQKSRILSEARVENESDAESVTLSNFSMLEELDKANHRLHDQFLASL